MRKSIISSLVADVVAIANDVVVAAGVVASAGLRRNSMREHLGNWHEPRFAFLEHCYQPADTHGDTGSTRLPNGLGNPLRVVSSWMQRSSKRSVQPAYALSPAYAVIARASRKG